MEDGLGNRFSTLQVLDYDSLQQSRRHSVVPHTVGIDDDDRTIAANTEAGRLSALHTMRAEEKVFTMQKLGQQGVELTPTRVW
jgi:hypothetical protein